MIRALVAFVICAGAATAQTVPEPSDYRMDHYRAPVPDRITGGTTIGPEAAHGLWQDKAAVFVDVLPQAPKPDNLPEDTIWRDKPRDSIPRAIWLPNVGYGAIAEVTGEYFRNGLETATAGDADQAVVFFCLEDCWMSWNAARRAIEWGYTNVYWFPEGTDGWTLWDYPLERVEPVPGQPVAGGG
ncbi:PQQ-dependent catabolism-associated CXXCW motif protein [Ruegeria arenilitoris]|uniref:PQQ-dependent catabolism-associated CXXCW motif protein n=1 Tax=Ruegeria arenilitoris TaxID=1173585 RepID=UPI0014814497|nr:PQQ-dependent catabolism-associated CXXCW motif protein [Ruegeria arenilitoris]